MRRDTVNLVNQAIGEQRRVYVFVNCRSVVATPRVSRPSCDAGSMIQRVKRSALIKP